MSTAAIFCCHDMSEVTADALMALAKSAGIPVFAMFDDRMKNQDRRRLAALDVCAHSFNAARWTEYKRPGRLKKFIPGNTEVPFLLFRKKEPAYEHYWFIEYDVRFTGAWSTFFKAWESSDADLLATSVASPREAPDWPLWRSLEHPDRTVSQHAVIRAFLPLCRLSARALDAVEEEYAHGLTGHSEVSLPTALRLNGLSIEDIGGSGPWVAEGNENRFYTSTPAEKSLAPGSFVFRPAMPSPGKQPNRLWHPVKSTDAWDVKAPKPVLRRLLGL